VIILFRAHAAVKTNAYHNRKGSVSDRTVEEETLGVGVWVVVTNIKSIPQRVTGAYAGREVVTPIMTPCGLTESSWDRTKTLRSRRRRPLREVSTKD
jgi:hypothetical protein